MSDADHEEGEEEKHRTELDDELFFGFGHVTS
jgi:hypothetical protein